MSVKVWNVEVDALRMKRTIVVVGIEPDAVLERC